MTAITTPVQIDARAHAALPHGVGSHRPAISPLVPLLAEVSVTCRIDAPHRAPTDHGPMAEARESVSRMIALPVERLPSRAAMQAAWGVEALSVFGASFGCPIALADSRRRLAAALPDPAADRWPGVTELVQRGNALDSDVHDAFFHIGRDEDHAARRHLATIFDAAAALQADLDDTETTLDEATLAGVASGIEETFALATGMRPARLTLPPRRIGVAGEPHQAARRWIRGHQIFLVITHGLVAALEDLATVMGVQAHTAPAAAGQIDAMAAFAALIDASAHAICLTGDFCPDIYDRVVRVAMAPPFMPEGFSGVFSSDHRHLVRRLREERPMFERLRNGIPGAHADVVASMIRLYDNHKLVCGRFIGVDRASLLMASGTGQTAVDQLEKFKQSRLRSLGVVPVRP